MGIWVMGLSPVVLAHHGQAAFPPCCCPTWDGCSWLQRGQQVSGQQWRKWAVTDLALTLKGNAWQQQQGLFPILLMDPSLLLLDGGSQLPLVA